MRQSFIEPTYYLSKWDCFVQSEVVLVSLTLKRFHTLFWCSNCWLWKSKYRLGTSGILNKHRIDWWLLYCSINTLRYRSSRSEVFCEKDNLKLFKKLTKNNWDKSLILILQHMRFFENFGNLFWTAFSLNWMAASNNKYYQRMWSSGVIYSISFENIRNQRFSDGFKGV